MAVVLSPDLQNEYLIPESIAIQIRPARRTDLAMLGELWSYHRQYHQQWTELYATTSSGKDHWQKQIALALDQPNQCVMVAIDPHGHVVGYIHGSFHAWPNSPIAYYGSLNTLTVAEHAQNEGIGRSEQPAFRRSLWSRN